MVKKRNKERKKDGKKERDRQKQTFFFSHLKFWKARSVSIVTYRYSHVFRMRRVKAMINIVQATSLFDELGL